MTFRAVKKAERKLQNALNATEVEYANLDTILEALRVRSGNLSLMTLTLGRTAHDIEARLWDYHVKVKGKFAALLKTFRNGHGKKRPVEKRKAQRLFADFTKASIRFYRAYIGRLPANFKDIPRVFEVAQRLEQTGLTGQTLIAADDSMRQILEDSCKHAVIRLGDLARWRESEEHKHGWAPAKGYYNLALSLDPADGLCYNGLAAIAVADSNQLEAVYNSYRAAIAGKPSPVAQSNIAREFEKVRERRKEDSYGLMDKSGEDLVETLEKRFLAFHAHAYTQPYDFVAFQQKANDICGMIALCFQETKHGIFDELMNYAVLINISAEALAKKGTMKPPDTNAAQHPFDRICQSFFLLQRFNLLVFQSLLKVLTREIGEPPPSGTDLKDLTRLSSVVRRVLPHLRQYSSWFLSNMRDLVEVRFKSSRQLLENVAKTYASTLNLLRASVDVFAPSPIQYLLAEDERTISFTPFTSKVYAWRYIDGNTKVVKPSRGYLPDGKSMAEELLETHLRVIDLVVDGLKLTVQKVCCATWSKTMMLISQDELGLDSCPLPIALENRDFVAKEIPENELPVAPPSPPKQVWRRTHQATASMGEIPESPSRPASQNRPATPQSPLKDASKGTSKRNKRNSAKQSQSQDLSSVLMQTAPEQPPQSTINSTINSSSIVTGTPALPPNGTLTALDLVSQMQKSSANLVIHRSPDSTKQYSRPVLPSVLKTPFTPTATEKAQLSPRLSVVQHRSPSFNSEPNSSAAMRENLARMEREIDQRPTPLSPWDPDDDTDYGRTPTGMSTAFRNFEGKDRTSTPFSQFLGINGGSSQAKTSPTGSPFGAIGQARPPQSTPPSGQGWST